MNRKLSVYCFSLILLIDFTGAKPAADLQTLKQLLEEINPSPYFSSEEVQGGDEGTDKSLFGALKDHWDSSDPVNSALREKTVLARLLKDVLRTTKRSWSRYKKGGLRSCFGVRLARIGSFSGLGC